MVRKLSIYFWGRFTHSLIMFKGLGGKHHHGNQRIEASEEGTSFTAPLEAMKVVRSKNGEILTKPFLDLCKMILPVLDNFGTSLSAVKSDVGGNIHVAMKLAPDRKKFVEVIGGTSRDLNAEMEQFCTSLSPFLKENHKFLGRVGMDNI
ncbi:Glycolipid transfer protein 1 [Linum perenne]